MSKNCKIYIYVFKLAIKKVIGKKSIFGLIAILGNTSENKVTKFEPCTSKTEKVNQSKKMTW